MKKCDLHVHTIKGVSDSAFDFSMDVLKGYVRILNIDVIAITNHNLFDYGNYMAIVNELTSTTVLPGIEVDLEGGHILLIANNDGDIMEFISKCDAVNEKIKTPQDTLTLQEFQNIFTDLSKYLLIPHYDKSPELPKPIIEALGEYIFAGEVSSVKKFLSMQKNAEERLTPVLFSDFRFKQGVTPSDYPIRQTFLEVNEVDVASLKLCLRDKTKVKLSEKDGNELFQIFNNGQMISTGLNIMYGKRSTGKSYTMNKIHEIYGDRAKYIKQFELLNNGREFGADQLFGDDKVKMESKVAEYMKPFKDVVDDIVLQPTAHSDENKIEEYLSCLLKKAEMENQKDLFSKTALYEESTFSTKDTEELENLIDATLCLIETTQFRAIVDQYVSMDSLKSLLKALVELLWKTIFENEQKSLANSIIESVKNELQLYSPIPQVPEINIYDMALREVKRKKFEEIVNAIKKPSVIFTEPKGTFTIRISKNPYQNVSDIKKRGGISTSLHDCYDLYDSPVDFLCKLKDYGVESSLLHKAFVGIDYKVMNSDGLEVSGGERSEFIFIQRIQDAQLYDILLIDEPESSFDNVFLSDQINGFIKNMASVMPVIVSTHNSTIGKSIKPNYVIYAEKKIENGERVFRLYSGYPDAKKLVTVNGDEIDNFEVTITSLEAGEKIYKERSGMYEELKNRK